MKNILFSKSCLSENEKNEVIKCMDSGWITTGKICHEFEEKFKSYVGAKFAIAVSSCTAALHMSLIVNDIGKDDEVITTPLTFVSTINVIEMCGAKPILVDIDKDTLNIDPSEIEKAITTKTKAIIVVHYAGHACDMDKINAISKKYNLAVIEDAAHGAGTEYKGNKIGNSNNLVCFSFYPTKNMTTCEGGMITTNNQTHIDKLTKLRLHGLTKDAWNRYSSTGNWKYDVEMVGYKYNMPDMFAAIGMHQLDKLDCFNKRRERISAYYRKRLNQYSTEVMMQQIKKWTKHSEFMFLILLKHANRDIIIETLKKSGVNTSVLFIPVYEFTYYKQKYNFDVTKLTVCEDIKNKLVCLPLYPDLSDDDAKFVIDQLVNSINLAEKNHVSCP